LTQERLNPHLDLLLILFLQIDYMIYMINYL
jgi:hypothetical protein